MKQEICRICLKTKKRHLNEMKGGARPWIAHNFEPKPQEGKCCKECRARHSQTPVAFSPCPCHAPSSPEVKKEAGNNMKPSEKIIDLVSQARKKYPEEDNEGNLWIQAIMDYLDKEYKRENEMEN